MASHAPAHQDHIIPQHWEQYTSAEHATWRYLFERQSKMLKGRACQEFLNGLHVLDLGQSGIPDFARLSETLDRLTGWTVVPVPGLIPDAAFFEHLANRRFPAGQFIRRTNQLDYLQEPDVFHDVFGHVPMLAHPVFADYMQAYGQGGLRSLSFDCLHHLARLYWYTVEFGLIRAKDGLRIYGSGIVSSYAESVYALESPIPRREAFDLKRVMRTPYCIDRFQDMYFIIDNFDDLLKETYQDFAPVYRDLARQPDLSISASI